MSTLRERLASEDLAKERQADRALALLEKTIFGKGANARSASSLKGVAGRFPGTLRGAEAERLAKLLGE